MNTISVIINNISVLTDLYISEPKPYRTFDSPDYNAVLNEIIEFKTKSP